MSYSLDYSDSSAAFLRNHQGLSRLGRIKLAEMIHLSLREQGDVLRMNPALRLEADSPHFSLDLLFQDGGRFHHFRLIVDDSAAEYDVLRIEYIDEF